MKSDLKFLRSISTAASLTVLAIACHAADYDWPKAKTGPEQSKTFTVTRHFHYVEQTYLPSVVIPLVPEEPKRCASAEEALKSQLSAMKALDAEWWVHTWDLPSQNKIKSRAHAPAGTSEDLIRNWKKVFSGGAEVSLTSWILTGEYVLISYTVGRKAAGSESQEGLVAFHISNGVWKATLDLEEDPVVLHLRDKNKVFERTVRE
jgi:hypothetical protein